MLTDPADRGGYLIWQTAHLIGRDIGEALTSFDLTPAQFGVVVHIGREPGLSAAELARRIYVTPQSMHTALQPLIERAWVQRRSHPVHRRVLGNFLTSEGLEAAHAASEAITAADNKLLETLSLDERTHSKDLTLRLLLALNPTALDRSSLRADRSS